MDKINLVISPSQQLENKCYCGDYEADHMHRIGIYLYENLRMNPQLNVYLIPQLPDTGNDKQRLKKAVSMANEFIKRNGGRGYHLALHSDAGGYATGASILYKSDAGLKFGAPIAEEIMRATPWNDVGLKARKDLYELNKTLAWAVLVEVSFHDNPEEARWIHGNMKFIADTLTRGALRGLGMT